MCSVSMSSPRAAVALCATKVVASRERNQREPPALLKLLVTMLRCAFRRLADLLLGAIPRKYFRQQRRRRGG